MPAKYQYIFGPVPSRRLGRSLGIDLIPYKTCSFNCIYCQLGQTTCQTCERAEYVPIKAVLRELEEKLKESRTIDYLTFSGSGEPTLHQELGKMIKKAKELFLLPVAVITNGSLLWMKEVQKDLAEADVVLPTLSSALPEKFQEIHRQDPGLDLKIIIEGMIQFRKKFSGQIWLEVFIVKGINDCEEDLELLKPVLDKIKPDRIQLNTSVRIPSEQHSISAEEQEMIHLARLLGERAEVIPEARNKKIDPERVATEYDILDYLKRRPGTIDDLSAGLSISKELARKLLKQLIDQGLISLRKWKGKEEYYFHS